MASSRKEGTQGLLRPSEDEVITAEMLTEDTLLGSEDSVEEGQIDLMSIIAENAPIRLERAGEPVSVLETISANPVTQMPESSANKTRPVSKKESPLTPKTAKRTPQTKNPEPLSTSVFTTLDPHDPASLAEYATSIGCTENGVHRFVSAITSQRFRGKTIDVLDLTSDLDTLGHLSLLSGAAQYMENRTDRNPNPKPLSGFTFDEKAAQKCLYVRGVIYTVLDEPDRHGHLQGNAKAQFLVLPETIAGVQGKPNLDTGMTSPRLPAYNPILRLLFSVVDNDGHREERFINIRGAAFVAEKARAAREFTQALPQYVYEILFDKGVTDEDMVVKHTTEEERAARAAAREFGNGRRRGLAAATGFAPGSTTNGALPSTALQNAVDRLGG